MTDLLLLRNHILKSHWTSKSWRFNLPESFYCLSGTLDLCMYFTNTVSWEAIKTLMMSVYCLKIDTMC